MRGGTHLAEQLAAAVPQQLVQADLDLKRGRQQRAVPGLVGGVQERRPLRHVAR